jgi:putative oxidoreductase
MAEFRNLALLGGRIFIASVFICDAFLLLRSPADSVAYMEQFGVPGALLWPTLAFELVGGMMIVAGLLTRLTSLCFAGFCLLTALIFHRDLADTTEFIQFGKDFGVAGGFLFLAVAGAGSWSLDALFRTDSWPLARGG